MAKNKKHGVNPAAAAEGGGFDMTPMIDVTFLLIIFFMCVTELADASKEKLKLPVATEAEVDEVIPGRLVINVNKEGEIKILGEEKSIVELSQILDNERAYSMQDGTGYPSRAVLIRADQKTKYGAVQIVLTACIEHKLWRIAFATAHPDFAK